MPATSSLPACGSRDSAPRRRSARARRPRAAHGREHPRPACQRDDRAADDRPEPGCRTRSPDPERTAALPASRNWCDSTAIWQISIAPPLAPCSSRPATSTGTFGAARTARRRANSTVPITYTRLRPNRSASVPAAISTVVHAIVRVHDPLHTVEIAMQHVFERRQDHRHARDFEAEHQRRETNGRERDRIPAGVGLRHAYCAATRQRAARLQVRGMLRVRPATHAGQESVL